MTGSIDLGQYLRLLLKWSWLIGLLTVLGLLAGLLFSMTRATTWQSTATVLVKPAPANVSVSPQTATQQIDPVTISAVIPDVPARSLVLMADTSDVEARVQQQLSKRPQNPFPARLCEPGSMLGHVMVSEVQGRPNILQVTATDRSQDLARELANVWAQLSSAYINSVLGAGFFDASKAGGELTKAEDAWNRSQSALTEFEKTSALPSVASRYAASQSLLADYLRQSNQLTLNLRTASELQSQLQSTTGAEVTNLPVTLLSLSSFTAQATGVDVSAVLPNVSSATTSSTTDTRNSDAHGSSASTTSSSPPQQAAISVQPTVDTIASLTGSQQLGFLRSLVGLLQQRQTQLTSDIDRLTGQIGDLRGQLDQLASQRDRLVSERDSYRTLYDNLNNLIRQQQAGASIQSTKVQVVGQAVGADSAGLRGVVAVVLGAVLGLVLG
ncbi:MAG: Wzz/FepE/Etk N-terminal domain-containing protein, partial [Chloroflexota bacterium]|nr:Wzz/FepE/Etk N-terminal domain-containing protein [Chloroflexota bacterium]